MCSLEESPIIDLDGAARDTEDSKFLSTAAFISSIEPSLMKSKEVVPDYENSLFQGKHPKLTHLPPQGTSEVFILPSTRKTIVRGEEVHARKDDRSTSTLSESSGTWKHMDPYTAAIHARRTLMPLTPDTRSTLPANLHLAVREQNKASFRAIQTKARAMS